MAQHSHSWPRLSVRALLLGTLLLLGSAAPVGHNPPAVSADVLATLPLAPFAAIHSPNPADYATYQLKFTYLGDQKKMVPSMAGVGVGRVFDAAGFVLYERDLDYGNDSFTGDTLVVPALEFKAFVDAIAAYPVLTDTSFVPEPNASLMILRDSGPLMLCWEHLATRGETDLLFQLLRDQITNPADTATVSSYRRQMAGVRR